MAKVQVNSDVIVEKLNEEFRMQIATMGDRLSDMLKAMEERMVAQMKTTMAATEAATAKDHHCKCCALNKTTTTAEAATSTATVTAAAATTTVTDQVGLRDRAQRAVEVTKVRLRASLARSVWRVPV